ncbi:MAG TPA: M28 family peptidase [Longimicrobiaceae bacterium]|nr:M28 family peptidase [Longimicrobiaceae bacterium]
MTRSRRAVLPLAAAVLAAAALAPSARAQAGELPRTHAPRPTTAPLSPADLMTRLYVLADDSMMGREAGTPGNVKGTDYIAAEFRRIGLEPAGEGGTFFQTVPLVTKGLEPGAALSVEGTALTIRRDWVPVPTVPGAIPFGAAFSAQGAPVVFGGRIGGQMLAPEQARGKLVVLLPPLGQDGQPEGRFWRSSAMRYYPGAAGIAVVSLEATPAGTLGYFMSTQMELSSPDPAPAADGAPGMLVSAAAAARLLGVRPEGLAVGAAGRTVTGAYRFAARPSAAPARNVIGLLRGSDPAARGQYVVIGAHNDHEGMLAEAVDHDSVRAYNRVMRPQGANDDPGEPSNGQWARFEALRDSLRRLHGGVRLDSVMNGADDDGSGTVNLLEIAEELAARGTRPRRSILFVSHTAEEKGLYGSQHFTDHPTVPLDSIVAALNMDMVGRGRAGEVANGGPWSIQMIGSRRLSTGLGDLIDALNAARPNPMRIDYSFDAAGHPLNRYCRSDHFMYARYGIPITYFSLGYHVDYHMASDEPQYIDYEHLARVGAFVRDVAVAIADRPERLVVDGPRQDPNAPCRQ